MSSWLSKFISEDLYIIRDGESLPKEAVKSAPAVDNSTHSSENVEIEVSSQPSVVIEEIQELAIIVDKVDLETNKDLLAAILDSIDTSLDEAHTFNSIAELSGRFKLTLHFDSETSEKYLVLGDENTVINSDTLESLNGDRALKLQLWNSLKQFKSSQKAQ